MEMVRKSLSWFSLYLVGVCFFLSAGLFAVFSVLNADNLKQTLSQEGTYDKFVPAALESASNSEQVEGQLPVGEPWVREAAEKSFPATDLEQKGGQAIDGTFAWLEGKTDNPEFSLDFSQNKNQLAENLGDATEKRLESLPACTRATLPSSIDVYRLNCRPLGISPRSISDKVSYDIKNDESLFKNPVISAESLAGENGGQNPFGPLEKLKPLFENKDLLKWLLPLATLAFAVVGYLLAENRYRALSRLFRTFMSAGVGLLVIAFVIGYGFEWAVREVAKDPVSRDIAAPVMVSLGHQLRMVYLISAGVAFALALALFLIRKKARTPAN